MIATAAAELLPYAIAAGVALGLALFMFGEKYKDHH
jgi:hypothetical protein